MLILILGIDGDGIIFRVLILILGIDYGPQSFWKWPIMPSSSIRVASKVKMAYEVQELTEPETEEAVEVAAVGD